MNYKKMVAILLSGAVASSLVLGGCGDRIDSDATVATLGDRDISLGYVNFVAHYTQSNYDGVFASYYGDDYWTNESYEDEDGLTMEESVKDSVMDEVELGYLLEDHMEDYGVEITDEDMDAIDTAAEEYMSENTDKAIRAMGATQSYAEDMLYYNTVTSRMEDAIKEEYETDLTVADFPRRTFSYIKINLDSYTDEDGQEVSYTDEEADALRESIPQIAQEAKADFDGAAEENDYTVSACSYDPADAEAEDSEEGETSDEESEDTGAESETADEESEDADETGEGSAESETSDEEGEGTDEAEESGAESETSDEEGEGTDEAEESGAESETSDEEGEGTDEAEESNAETDEDGDEFPEEVLVAANSMTQGQVSDAIEGDDCYYIIRLDSENDEEASESALEEAVDQGKEDYYTEVTDGYKEDADFNIDEDEWAKVKFTTLFSNDGDEEEDEGSE